jgi:fused signal recognition particle receptor
MNKWLSALVRTREALRSKAERLWSSATPEAVSIGEWEEVLIRADVPVRIAACWAEELRQGDRRIPADQRLQELVRRALPPRPPYEWSRNATPRIFLIVGVNGSGKTTTAAKLAFVARRHGLTPLLAATDTFRAAGTDQLRIWAQRAGCEVVAGRSGADAAAVAYDAVSAGLARGVHAVFIDTAGRMHTKQHLMAELGKIWRSISKALAGAPHECWIVLDASLGDNAVKQAELFKARIGLSGAVIAKLDGSSKAGFVLAVENELGVPIRYVGLGEGLEDLVPFDPAEFGRALIADGKHEQTG